MFNVLASNHSSNVGCVGLGIPALKTWPCTGDMINSDTMVRAIDA